MSRFSASIFALSLALGGCKPKVGTSELATLGNAARTGAAVQSACVGTHYGAQSEPRLEFAATYEPKALAGRALNLAVVGALSAIPDRIRAPFFAKGGSVRIDPSLTSDDPAKNVCLKIVGSDAIARFSAEGERAPRACWGVEADGTPRIYLAPSPAVVRHQLVRMFGAAVNDLYLGGMLATRDQVDDARRAQLDHLLLRREALVSAFDRDVVALQARGRNDVSLDRYKTLRTSAEGRAVYASLLVAEAFDSLYCSDATRTELQTDFPNSSAAIASIAAVLEGKSSLPKTPPRDAPERLGSIAPVLDAASQRYYDASSKYDFTADLAPRSPAGAGLALTEEPVSFEGTASAGGDAHGESSMTWGQHAEVGGRVLSSASPATAFVAPVVGGGFDAIPQAEREYAQGLDDYRQQAANPDYWHSDPNRDGLLDSRDLYAGSAAAGDRYNTVINSGIASGAWSGGTNVALLGAGKLVGPAVGVAGGGHTAQHVGGEAFEFGAEGYHIVHGIHDVQHEQERLGSSSPVPGALTPQEVQAGQSRTQQNNSYGASNAPVSEKTYSGFWSFFN